MLKKKMLKKRRESLQKAIDDYVNDFYLQGVNTVFPSQESVKEMFVVISSSKFNEKKFLEW